MVAVAGEPLKRLPCGHRLLRSVAEAQCWHQRRADLLAHRAVTAQPQAGRIGLGELVHARIAKEWSAPRQETAGSFS